MKINKTKRLHVLLAGLSIALAPSAVAQKWEIGGAAGGSFYTSQSVQSPSGNADASIATGLAASAWLGNNSGNLLGGEFRYDYTGGNLSLTGNGGPASFAARSQAFHYDFLIHFSPRASRVRPYVAFGGGAKIYSGTGTEQAYQPLEQIALLTKTSQTMALISAGAGIKFNMSDHLQLRVEVHDYLTPFPKNVIAPAQGARVGGWLQQFVPTFGIAYVF